MQQVQHEISQHEEGQSLAHKALDMLFQHSNGFYFLLNDQLCIQSMNRMACEFFSVEREVMQDKHLPSWFLQNGLVPPLFHADSAKNDISRKSFQTKIMKADEECFIDWECEWIASGNHFSEGVLLKGILKPLLRTKPLPSASSITQESSSIFDAVHHHFEQMSSLANQTLLNHQQDAIGLKIAIQTILQSIERSSQLLAFASILEKNQDTASTKAPSVVLQKVLQSIIEKYQSEYTSMSVQISLQNQQVPSSAKQICDKDHLAQGLSALIMPLLCFLEKGCVKISVFQNSANSKTGLTHIQCKIKGEDAFGHSIQDWFTQKTQALKTHQTLHLHWLLGKKWLEHLHGLYQVQMIASEVHIDMALPYELETAVLANNPLHEKIPHLTAEMKPKATITLDYKNDRDPLTQELRNSQSVAILLIEDNEMNQRAVLQIIHRLYGQVYFKVASSAKDAVEAYQQAPYDLILMDIGLPDNLGLQLAYRLRRLEVQLERSPAPICILSAHYSRAMYEEECESGLKDTLVQDFYTKPLLPLKAQALIDHWIPQTQKRRYEVHA